MTMLGQMYLRKRMWASLTLAIGLLVAAAVACGGSSPTATNAPPAPTATSAAPQPTATSSGNTGGARDITDVPLTTTSDLSINGAGASFPFVLYSKFASEYNNLNSGIRVNYNSIGSGGGIRQVIEKTVHFGGTDGPMNDEQKSQAGGTVLHIPIAMGAVVPAYNLPGSPQLRFSPETIVDIFLGKITEWNDPAIAADNPGVTLPNMDIAVVHRSDGSGTTFIWVDYLSSVSQEWKDQIGTGTSVNWPVGIGAPGNEGVANTVRQIPGAIGYVELAYATQNNLSVPQLKNRDGFWITPDFDSVSAAAGGMISAGLFPENMEARVVHSPGEHSYGASGFTWYLIYEDLSVIQGMNLELAQELIRYALWSLSADHGQSYHVDLDYAPLDPLVIDMAQQTLKKVKFNGTPVWETMLP